MNPSALMQWSEVVACSLSGCFCCAVTPSRRQGAQVGGTALGSVCARALVYCVLPMYIRSFGQKGSLRLFTGDDSDTNIAVLTKGTTMYSIGALQNMIHPCSLSKRKHDALE